MVVKFEELTRDELRELAPTATVVVPVGSIEQHGPHLPVCVDTAIVTHVAQVAAVRAAATVPVVVTPSLPFGFAHHHLSFGGTISISARVYLDVLTEIGKSLSASGFRRIIYLNGHGGNAAAVAHVTDRLGYEDAVDVHVAATSYWICAADVLADLDLGNAPKPGHAGAFETSLLLALRPDLVKTDRFPEPESELQPLSTQARSGFSARAMVRHPGIWEVSDGRTDDSHRATKEIGERALSDIADRVSEFIISFHKESS